MISKLHKVVRRQDTIEQAWRVVQENARSSTSTQVRQEVDAFAEASGKRIRSLCHRLARDQFEFGKAKGIPIPKKDPAGRATNDFRPIVLASVEARIVQRALLEVLLSVPALDRYINTPHSFGGLRKAKLEEGESKRAKPAAVPAAIKGVLEAIESGARFYASADIKAFFTKVSKEHVTSIISAAVDDLEFLTLFTKAIKVELSNMSELRGKASRFPIQEIGVAQGNSLSPLLGNIALAAFDQVMNEGDCRCLRYIDDFIILAPTRRAADARLRKATDILSALGMELSPAKSTIGGLPIDSGLTFLGVEIVPGFVRPSAKAQQSFLRSIADEFDTSSKAFREVYHGNIIGRRYTLISTLKRVEGIIDGWGKHYWFCNDREAFAQLDIKTKILLKAYLGGYSDSRARLPSDKQHLLLGLPFLSDQNREPFAYPRTVSR